MEWLREKKCLPCKTDDLNKISETQCGERELIPQRCSLISTYILWHWVQEHNHTHIQIKKNLKNMKKTLGKMRELIDLVN